MYKSKKFGTEEKIKKKKTIDELFSQKSFVNKLSLFTMRYMESTDEECNKVAFVVPKSKIKLAVDRNKVKRRIKEAYRLKKERLEVIEKKVFIVFVFNGYSIPKYIEIESSMEVHINFLISFFSKNFF